MSVDVLEITDDTERVAVVFRVRVKEKNCKNFVYCSERLSRKIFGQKYNQGVLILFFADLCKRNWRFEVGMLTHPRRDKKSNDFFMLNRPCILS